MLIEIKRLGKAKDLQLGVMLIDGLPAFTTAELPWRDNKSKQSCIPVGEYKCHRYNSKKFKTELWKLDDVPGRDLVEIHWGNFPANTDGCIMIGIGFGLLRGIHTINFSRVAFVNFMKETEAETELTLRISNDEERL